MNDRIIHGTLIRNVFIDTSIFVSENFNIAGTKFKTLAYLAQANRIYIKSSDITYREIISNIEENVESAEKSIHKTKKEARILRNLGHKSSYKALFADFPRDKIVDKISKQIRRYFISSKIEIIRALKTSPAVVFDKYFNKKPPFGLEKKKSEFPDAFVLSALEDWCDKNNQSIFVISHDPDMASACCSSERLEYLPSLQAFLGLVIDHDQAIAKLAHERFQRNVANIRNLISDQLEGSYVFLKDQDGEGTITSISEIILGDPSIINITDQVVTFEFQSKVFITADIWFKDLDTATYDSEEKRLIPWRDIEQEVEREVDLPVELSFTFSSEDDSYFLLHHILVNDGEPFDIWVDEDTKTFYK